MECTYGDRKKESNIEISENIGFDEIGRVIKVLNLSKKEGVSTVTFFIDSPGGNPFAVDRLVKYLEANDFEFQTHNLNRIHSSAHILFHRGSSRTMELKAEFMIHGVTNVYRGRSYSRSEFERIAETLPSEDVTEFRETCRVGQALIDDSIRIHTNISQVELDSMNSNGEHYFHLRDLLGTKYALGRGLAQNVRTVDVSKIPNLKRIVGPFT